MKPLTSLLWSAAFVVMIYGCTLAIRAHRLADSLPAAASSQPNANVGPATRAPSPVAAAQSALPASNPAGSKPTAPSAPPWKPAPESVAAHRARWTNSTPLPRSNSAREAQDTLRIRLRYHAFYAANGLTPAQISSFEKALAGKLDPFANFVNVPPDQEASLREMLGRNLDTAVRKALGEDMIPKMREFVATADYRDVADKLAGNTFQTDTPLTAVQADRLVQTCLACRTAPGNGLRNSPDAVDWDQVLLQSQSFLTPTQLRTLQTMTDMRRFDQEFRRATGLSYRANVRNF